MVHKERCRLMSTLFLVLILILALATRAMASNLLENPGFEEQVPGEFPPGWIPFGSVSKLDESIIFTKGDAAEGQWFLTIKDESTTLGYGLKNKPVPAEPGKTYMAKAQVKMEKGSLLLYLEFLDANNRRINHVSVSRSSSQAQDWTAMSVNAQAPPGTVYAAVILYSTTTTVAIGHFDDISLREFTTEVWAEEGVESSVGADRLDYTPENESVVTTNPPSFVWLPIPGAQKYALEYSTSPDFEPENTTRVTDIDISIYTPPNTLDDEKTWFWRVQGIHSGGAQSLFTDTRTFRISSDAAILPLPPLDEVRARIPQKHPRLFVTEENIDDFLANQKGGGFLKSVIAKEGDPHLTWMTILANANNLAKEPLPKEPPHCRPGGVWDVNLWRQYTMATRAVDNLETIAFAYMLTGDKTLGEAARRWMLHIASWDPKGATSAAVNDECSMPILYKMSRAYTWAYDALTPEDRKVICDVMRIRGNEAYQILKRRPFESRPFGSHEGRSLGFLGEAAIAFLGEIPEAEEWFDYVVQIFFAIYPAWGGDPGGWAEGHAYWASYINRVLWFVDALEVATDLNLYEKAFFKNTGYFKLYTHPPYSKMGPFGDFADRGPARGDGNVMAHFSAVYKEPYFLWYAKALKAENEGGVMGYIRNTLHPKGDLKEKSPQDLPASRYFPDIGWVVLHETLGKESIQFMFKSSPYGSFSHSLADQNTFTIEAYGVPLAISSGYRPWYGSEHHMKWTKTTQAHNGILVDGYGQIAQSLDAKGQITDFIHGDSFDYTAGDAAQAYGKLLDKFVRHVVYIRPDLFVIYDDILAPEPSKYSWLLHTYKKMDVDNGRISLSSGISKLQIQLWSSGDLTYSQTDKFAIPLDEHMNKPVQWHLTATTDEASRDGNFLAVLLPSKLTDSRVLNAKPIDQGVTIEDKNLSATVLFAKGEEELKGDKLQARASVAAWQKSTDKKSSKVGLLLVDGIWLKAEDFHIESSIPITFEMTIDNDGSIIGNFNIPWIPGSESVEVSITRSTFKGASLKVEAEIPWELKGDTLHMTFEPGQGQKVVIRR